MLRLENNEELFLGLWVIEPASDLYPILRGFKKLG
jgi:hypothetical protein